MFEACERDVEFRLKSGASTCQNSVRALCTRLLRMRDLVQLVGFIAI